MSPLLSHYSLKTKLYWKASRPDPGVTTVPAQGALLVQRRLKGIGQEDAPLQQSQEAAVQECDQRGPPVLRGD